MSFQLKPSKEKERIQGELHRLEALAATEKTLRSKGFSRIAGIDEVGRGPLAGPVVAVACVLPEGFFPLGMDDSKKLTPKKRLALYEQLLEREGVDLGIGILESKEVDRLNVHRATLEAMRRSLLNLKAPADFLLVDGCHCPPSSIPSRPVVGGDRSILAIAAASIVAKVIRDWMMELCHALYPHYGFAAHKGYGTKRHLEALEAYGSIEELHRYTFRGVAR